MSTFCKICGYRINGWWNKSYIDVNFCENHLDANTDMNFKNRELFKIAAKAIENMDDLNTLLDISKITSEKLLFSVTLLSPLVRAKGDGEVINTDREITEDVF